MKVVYKTPHVTTDCQSEFLFRCFGPYSVASYSSQVLMHEI